MTITCEQLEKAAKAAGINPKALDWKEPDRWHPHIDHGQLHDLAMACEIDIIPSAGSIEYFTRTKYGGTQLCGMLVNCQDFPALAEAVILAACEQFDAKGGE